MFTDIPASVVSDILASLFLALLAGLGVWLRRQLRGIGRMTRDWNGEPARPGISDGSPGVMQRLYRQDQQFTEVMAHLGRQDSTLEEIRHEITYNSGSSIKDAVHRTDKAVGQLQTDMTEVKSKLEGRTTLEVTARVGTE